MDVDGNVVEAGGPFPVTLDGRSPRPRSPNLLLRLRSPPPLVQWHSPLPPLSRAALSLFSSFSMDESNKTKNLVLA